MSRTNLRTKRIPFSLTVELAEYRDNISHRFSKFLLIGWGKKRGRKVFADIDKVFKENEELKDDLEFLDGIEKLESAADNHVKHIFKRG